MNTIVAMSWTMDQPTAARPWALSISPRSISCFSTTMVDDSDRQAPTMSASRRSAPSTTITRAAGGQHDEHLGDAARDDDASHGPQLADRELHAEGEQQQHDADLGEDGDPLLSADEARRERPDDDARQEVADDGRLAQTDGDRSADERRDDRAAEIEDERELLGQLERHEPGEIDHRRLTRVLPTGQAVRSRGRSRALRGLGPRRSRRRRPASCPDRDRPRTPARRSAPRPLRPGFARRGAPRRPRWRPR